MVSTPEGIAIAEICVYIPIFILTLIVVIRHGFQKQLGWIYLAIFCLVRIIGAGFKIASVHNPDSTTDVEWAAILQSVGLSPLLMATMGLLKRVTDEVSNHIKSGYSTFNGGIANIITNRASADSRRSRIIQIAQLPVMIALILAVAGGSDQSDSDASDISKGKTLTKVAVVIFLIIYILVLALVIITFKDIGKASAGEKRIFFAVAGALPLLAVRVLWSLLSALGHNSDFSLTGGKPLVQLFMATIEEFIVVCFYTLVGLTANSN